MNNKENYLKRIRIYVRAYRPFILGGNVHAMLALNTVATGPFDLGKGFKGYIVTNPKGQTYVAEATSGGIVGASIEEVRADIEACTDVKMMEAQIDECRKNSDGACTVSETEFWKGMKQEE